MSTVPLFLSHLKAKPNRVILNLARQVNRPSNAPLFYVNLARSRRQTMYTASAVSTPCADPAVLLASIDGPSQASGLPLQLTP
jgi:hypothetical protein